jgi:hypothetical protein
VVVLTVYRPESRQIIINLMFHACLDRRYSPQGSGNLTVVLLGPAPDPVALRGCTTVASEGYSAQQSSGVWGWPQLQSSSSFSDIKFTVSFSNQNVFIFV